MEWPTVNHRALVPAAAAGRGCAASSVYRKHWGAAIEGESAEGSEMAVRADALVREVYLRPAAGSAFAAVMTGGGYPLRPAPRGWTCANFWLTSTRTISLTAPYAAGAGEKPPARGPSDRRLVSAKSRPAGHPARHPARRQTAQGADRFWAFGFADAVCESARRKGAASGDYTAAPPAAFLGPIKPALGDGDSGFTGPGLARRSARKIARVSIPRTAKFIFLWQLSWRLCRRNLRRLLISPASARRLFQPSSNPPPTLLQPRRRRPLRRQQRPSATARRRSRRRCVRPRRADARPVAGWSMEAGGRAPGANEKADGRDAAVGY
jgi:hypothetical protein